jgi:hypothetical protein
MTSHPRVTCLIGLAAALVVSTSGCDPYTYYNVDIKLSVPATSSNAVDRVHTLPNVTSCDVAVYASDSPDPIEFGIALNERNLGPKASPCRGTETANNPDSDLGILDYSTARTSGSMSFKVNLYSDKTVIIQGSTDPVGVSPGHILNTVYLVVSPCGPPGDQFQPNQQPCN